MAIGRRSKGKGVKDQGQPEGYLSDESDFYGDDVTRRELEDRAASFSASEYWETQTQSVTEIAITNLASSQPSKDQKFYNPYEGCSDARQLSETVEEFLERLPPATTPVSEDAHWIYISNPYRKAPSRVDDLKELTAEGPLNEETDWAKFVRAGTELLQQLTGIRHDIEKKNPRKTKGQITKLVNKEKDVIVKKLLDTAVELHCSSGKWMIFCQNNEIDPVWEVVARATANNELGTAAKVARFNGNTREAHVICIYTEDFTDMKDVSRVVFKLKDLGIIEKTGKPIYYKCDAYTYLGLKSDNQWGIQASLYKSSDMFQTDTTKKDTKVDGFFYKK